ncbi:hypothetical protein ESP131_09250 [Exiguobacterium sp. U13-1]|uniref:Uncharacterized protein n=1 Tax=Exiguobacterium acetylicum TaxID=41170 RepID=A0ABX8GDE8_EXIAC|nr:MULTISPECIES: hypothetical protein [Exiguobacterium]AOT00433.1 hypothetical protein ESP131_09250 [Exiguobacterium sp. U13-1]QWB31394.1 hypothetical protein KKI46_07040 [Exiguobacterium acetylicum]
MNVKGMTYPLIEERDKKQVYWIEQGESVQIGQTYETIRFEKTAHQSILVREQELVSEKIGNRTIRLMIDAEDYAPLEFFEYQDGVQTVYASYGGDEVVITRGNEQSVLPIRTKSVDLFSIELLLRVLPLAVDSTLSFNGFSAVSGREVPIQVNLLRNELLTTESGEHVETLCVHVTFGERIQYYWIDPVKRELLKQSSQIADGVSLEFRR